MSSRVSAVLIPLSGILGIVLLGLYFGLGFSLGLATIPANATLEQVIGVATQYYNQWLMGTWLQATGSLLSVIFFIALVQKANAATKLAGMLTVLGSAVLLAVVLIEGVFTIDLALAAANGHQATSLTSFDLMTVFTHIYPLAPAPLIFLALGSVLMESTILPRIFAYLAIALGVAFEVVGLVSLFTVPWLTIVVLSLQSVWVLAAAIIFLIRAFRMPTTAIPQTRMS